MSPSKESKGSQSVDGQDEAEMFQERTTYTTHAVDGDDGANGDNTHAKAFRVSKANDLTELRVACILDGDPTARSIERCCVCKLLLRGSIGQHGRAPLEPLRVSTAEAPEELRPRP